MKQLAMVLISCALLAAGCGTINTHVGDSPSGQIGYWRFDGNGTDLSGGGRDLDLKGGMGFAAGLCNQALDLHNNGSQFAARPSDDAIYNFGSNDFTIQVWVNFNNTDWEQTLIEKFHAGAGPGWTLTKLNGDQLHFYARPAIVLTSAPLSIPRQKWHHIVVRRSGPRYQLIYDGKVVAEEANPAAVLSLPSTTAPLLIGRRNQEDGRTFSVNGRIDEVGIWSRALSDSEIGLLWNGGKGPGVNCGRNGQFGSNRHSANLRQEGEGVSALR